MSGGVDSSVVAALAAASGAEVDRHHAPALRLRRRDRAQGRVLRRRRHPRRARGRRPARHRALRVRSRERVPRGGGRALRRRLPRRAHPDPVHPLQHGAQVHRPAAHGARARRRLPRDRALRPPGDRRRRARAAPRARSGARPVAISSTRTTEAQLDFLRFPLGGLPKSEVRRIAEAAGLRSRGQARQPGHLLRARRRLCRDRRASCAPKARGPGEIVHAATGEVLGRARGRDPLHRRPAARARDRRPARAALRDGHRRGGAPRCGSGPSAMLAVGAARLVETNRIGPLPDAPLTAKVRSLAKPVPVTLEGPLGDGARGARSASPRPNTASRRGRRRCSMRASAWSAAAGSRRPSRLPDPPRRLAFGELALAAPQPCG